MLTVLWTRAEPSASQYKCGDITFGDEVNGEQACD